MTDMDNTKITETLSKIRNYQKEITQTGRNEKYFIQSLNNLSDKNSKSVSETDTNGYPIDLPIGSEIGRISHIKFISMPSLYMIKIFLVSDNNTLYWIGNASLTDFMNFLDTAMKKKSSPAVLVGIFHFDETHEKRIIYDSEKDSFCVSANYTESSGIRMNSPLELDSFELRKTLLQLAIGMTYSIPHRPSLPASLFPTDVRLWKIYNDTDKELVLALLYHNGRRMRDIAKSFDPVYTKLTLEQIRAVGMGMSDIDNTLLVSTGYIMSPYDPVIANWRHMRTIKWQNLALPSTIRLDRSGMEEEEEDLEDDLEDD